MLGYSKLHYLYLMVSLDLYKNYQYLFENSLVLYIRLPEGMQDKVPSEIDFAHRDLFLNENSEIVVNLQQKAVKNCVNKICDKLGEYYEDC